MEVVYQTLATGMTITLKDSNKRVWPQFPLHLGIYSLSNYIHVENELKPIEALKLGTIPAR